MDDLIRRSDAIEAIEVVDWYHQNRNKDMVSGANSDEHQAWYKADDVYKALEAVPSADRPQGEAPLEHGYMWTCPKCELEVHSDFDTCPRCGYEREDRPQGEWLDTGKDPDHSHPLTAIWYRCSECGDGTNAKTNFCPYCGARMKGADDDIH